MMKNPTTALACLLVAAALAACTKPTTPADDRPFAGQTLTILDHGSFAAFDAIKPLFENQTGARLTHLEAKDAGDALRQALLAAGNPVADVLYGVDNGMIFTPGVREKRLFVPYESPHLDRINRTLVNVEQFRDPDNRDLLATPVDHGYVSVNYDARLTNTTNASELPRTLRDLATAKWAPRFVTQHPEKSSPGLGFLVATVETFTSTGNYTWMDYWHDLFRNGTLVVDDWVTAYQYHFTAGYGQGGEGFIGDRAIVTSYTTSPAVEVFFSGDALTAPPSVSLEPRRGVFHQVETMAILRGTAHRDLARAFIDFCLTNDFQNQTAPTMAMYPVVDGIEIPRPLREFATSPDLLNHRLVPGRFTAIEIGLSLDDWLDEWTSIARQYDQG